MYLDKLVVNGFKSFAEKTEFKFEHPFTAIVGPNGSGKTNVSDAMRWVMGEQSLKLMRMKQSTDAIFAGSTKRSRLGMARVDLHLKNPDGRLNIEYPEVVLSRKLTRDGDTEYLINNSKARLQDIILLLAQANFGQKSYGVIGQGMITDILNANPQDRKEFFDEATGVKEFQIKRDQSINKLIRTEQNLLRAEDLLNEIEPRLKSLKRQVKKLERRKELEEELADIQVHYYGSLLAELSNQLKRLDTDLTTAKTEQTAVEQQLHTIEEEIDTIGRQESRTELYQRLQQEYNGVIDRKNELLKQQAILKGRLEVEHERTGEVDILWMQRRVDEIQRQIDNNLSEQNSLKESISHSEGQLGKVEGSQKTVQQEIEHIRTSIEDAKRELISMTEVLSVPEIKERLSHLFAKQEQFLREILETTSLEQFKGVQKEAEGITSELAELLDELHEDRAEEVALKKKEITALEDSIKRSTELKEKLLRDATELQVQIKSNTSNIGVLTQSTTSLTKEHTSLVQDIKDKQAEAEQRQDKSAQLEEITKRTTELQEQLGGIEGELSHKKESLDEFNRAEEKKKQRLLELQTDARRIQAQLNQLSNKVQSVEIEIVKRETKQEDILGELAREVSQDTEEKIKAWDEEVHDTDQLLVQIERLKHQLDLIGGIDPETIAEFEQTEERFSFLHTQSTDLRDTINSLEEIIDELDATIKRQFNKSFRSIAKSFEKYFETIFEGGDAKLKLITDDSDSKSSERRSALTTKENGTPEEPAEPEEEGYVPIGQRKKRQHIVSGIDIIAQPPGKKLASVAALSGGEKSMTAIALICAIIDANTPPFVVLDEVEAALDESNSAKFAAIIRQLSEKTQFIVISHNRATMQQADVLYGVTMKEGTSRILSVKMTEAEQMLDQE